jgi:uncharacterized protein YbcI
MSDPRPDDRAVRSLAGGRLLAEITNRIVSLVREHYGRGPIKAKTYLLDNLVVCVLTDSGFTAIERTMMGGGEPERVLEMRRDFQRMMKARYSEMIEELTGRKVLAFLSQAHVEPDLTIEMFLMDGPLAGFGALELVDPGDGKQRAPRRERVLYCGDSWLVYGSACMRASQLGPSGGDREAYFSWRIGAAGAAVRGGCVG